MHAETGLLLIRKSDRILETGYGLENPAEVSFTRKFIRNVHPESRGE
jgi:hypothetical protein